MQWEAVCYILIYATCIQVRSRTGAIVSRQRIGNSLFTQNERIADENTANWIFEYFVDSVFVLPCFIEVLGAVQLSKVNGSWVHKDADKHGDLGQ